MTSNGISKIKSHQFKKKTNLGNQTNIDFIPSYFMFFTLFVHKQGRARNATTNIVFRWIEVNSPAMRLKLNNILHWHLIPLLRYNRANITTNKILNTRHKVHSFYPTSQFIFLLYNQFVFNCSTMELKCESKKTKMSRNYVCTAW